MHPFGLSSNVFVYIGGFLVKSSAGRVIINHIGSEEGFLDGGDDVFISKKDTKDYHGTMDSVRYLEWFKKVLLLVPNKSVLVLDQAPYHRKRVETTINPTTSWRKQLIIDFLERNNVPKPLGINQFKEWTRPKLLNLARQNRIPTKFVVEDLCEKSGKEIKVLWLPPAHCEFNAIELIWAGVKGHISTCNDGSKSVDQIMTLAEEALARVTPEQWKKCIRHAIKYEERMWERDKLLEDNVFETNISVKISIKDDDTSSEESDSDYDSECSLPSL